MNRSQFKNKVSFAAISLLLILLPGLNDYDQLIPRTQISPVKNAQLTLPEIADYPVRVGVAAPLLSARGAFVMDAESATVLYRKNPDTLLLPASTTKIMSALVALESYDLDDVVTIKEESDSIGHSMNLVKGEKISVKNLLYGILVESGNDAAFALAQNYPGGYSAFIDRMNEKTQELQLENTHFRNVSGVEQFGHLTTVRDLAILAKAAMKHDIFARVVGTKYITVKSADNTITHNLSNINDLLGVVPGIKGVKTGWTENAGECLVTATERNNREIITVVLGSGDRFGETQELIEWAYANHQWQKTAI